MVLSCSYSLLKIYNVTFAWIHNDFDSINITKSPTCGLKKKKIGYFRMILNTFLTH